MSIPLAIERRLEQNPSQLALWRHIGLRALGLIVLGLILANGEKGDPTRMGISQATWTLLGLAAAILFWLAPSRDARFRFPNWNRPPGTRLLLELEGNDFMPPQFDEQNLADMKVKLGDLPW
jgi:hypothetical protein